MVEAEDKVKVDSEVSECNRIDEQESEIARLKSELFDEKMAKEADRSRFKAATRLMEKNYNEQFNHAKEMYERRLKEEKERLLTDFVVSTFLPMFDTLNQTVRHFEHKNPEITETIKITLKRLATLLNARGFHEIIVNIGDDYDANLHNPIEIVVEKKADVVHQVFHNAWIFKKENQEKIIRLADVIITKAEG